MFLTNRGTSEYYFPYTQIRAVAHMVPITVQVNWRIMRLEKSLSGEVYGQFSIGTCSKMSIPRTSKEPPSAQENNMVKIPNKKDWFWQF